MVYTEQKRQSIQYNYNISHTLNQLLKCVEDEYDKDIKISRSKKITILKKMIKKKQNI